MHHKAMVFVSCGQRGKEADLAKQIQETIKAKNFACFNADTLQSFDDVPDIIEHLSYADYYLFIDFKRTIDETNIVPISVFTHQELALARFFRIPNILAFREEGLKAYGLSEYLLIHPKTFNRENLVSTVSDAIDKMVAEKKWDPYFSRNLVVQGIKKANGGAVVSYNGIYEKIWHITVENRRSDRAACNATVIVESIRKDGSEVDINTDRAYLKWAKQSSYSITIFPKSNATFDAFATRVNERGIFLHSCIDITPRKPVLEENGTYELTYLIYAESFQPVREKIKITYTDSLSTIQIHNPIVSFESIE